MIKKPERNHSEIEMVYGHIAKMVAKDISIDLFVTPLDPLAYRRGFDEAMQEKNVLCAIPYDVMSIDGLETKLEPRMFKKDLCVTLEREDFGGWYKYWLEFNNGPHTKETYVWVASKGKS